MRHAMLLPLALLGLSWLCRSDAGIHHLCDAGNHDHIYDARHQHDRHERAAWLSACLCDAHTICDVPDHRDCDFTPYRWAVQSV